MGKLVKMAVVGALVSYVAQHGPSALPRIDMGWSAPVVVTAAFADGRPAASVGKPVRFGW